MSFSTPAPRDGARLQQIGLFTLIFAGNEDGQPVTAAQLANLTGQNDSQIARMVRKLMARDLIERKAGPGRGQPWILAVKQSPAAKKLIEAMSGK